MVKIETPSFDEQKYYERVTGKKICKELMEDLNHEITKSKPADEKQIMNKPVMNELVKERPLNDLLATPSPTFDEILKGKMRLRIMVPSNEKEFNAPIEN